MEKSLAKRLLFDFFDGTTTSIQRKLIEEWMADPENEELYFQYLDEWESQHPQFSPDSQEAWGHYRAFIKGENNGNLYPLIPEEQTSRFRVPGWLWGAIAACLLLALGFLFQFQIRYKSLESPMGRSASYQLSDGTHVTLNSNSVLWVPRFGFGQHTREVRLQGEAEFKVTHTLDNDRFVVRMDNDYFIEVLGTEFVAFSGERGKRVFLTKGKVKLKLPEGKQLYMKPGNLFTSNNRGEFKMTNPAVPEQYTAWKDHQFYFDDTLLSEVAIQLQERFNVKIRIQDTLLANRRIGGIYKAENADDLLQTLSELIPIEVIQKQDYIELRGTKLP